MWNAIKSDLADFVSTVKDDTTKTLNHVLGEDDEEEDETYVVQNKLIANLRRSYETYSTPVNEKKSREFERYLDSFTLTEFASDIASVLDEEPEVSRFYAELVPAQATPEEFWARLFFRVKLVYRHSEHEEDDDEEDLVWDEGDSSQPVAAGGGGGGPDSFNSSEHGDSDSAKVLSTGSGRAAAMAEGSAHNNTNTSGGGVAKINSQMSKKINELEDENSTLKGQVKTLVGRVAQLEQELKALRVASRNESNQGEEQQQLHQQLHQQNSDEDGNTSPTLAQEARHDGDDCDENGNDADVVKSPVSSHSNSSSNSNNSCNNNNSKQSSHHFPSVLTENASVSSETSGVLVSAGDLSSCDGDALKTPSAAIQATSTVTAATNTSGEDKLHFLAALDDDEEEDGWS